MDILSRTITIIVITVLYSAVAESVDCNATFKSSSENGDNVFAFQAGTNATINITYQCRDYYRNERIYIYWTKSGQDATAGRKFGYIRIFYGNLYWYNINSLTGMESYKYYNFGEQGIQLKFTNIDETSDQHLIYMIEYKSWDIIASQLVTVVYHNCSAADLPSELNYSPMKQVYSYNDTVRAKCLLDSLFLNGSIYYAHINVTCGQYGKWKIPIYECSPGCPSPANEFLQINPKPVNDKYKVSTEFNVNCQTGRLYTAGSPHYFMTDSRIVCRRNRLWSHNDIGCWQDQSVDFTTSAQTLLSNQTTVFACASRVTSYRVRITVKDKKIEDEVAAWLLVTPSSKYNGIIATCEVTDSSGIIVEKTSTVLNILYAPELPNDVNNLQFKLQQKRSGRAVIKFNANPLLSLDDIKIEKNGEKIENYYLKSDGFTHNVVVDFVKVNASDFGDYVITVTTHAPVKRILAAQFTISKTEESAKQLTVGDGAAITLASVIVVSLIAVAVYMTSRMRIKSKPKIATERREDVVTYEPDVPEHHNYEDIDIDHENEISQDQRECDGYVNMEFEGSNQNEYTSEQSRGNPTITSPANTGHKVPMNHPSGRKNMKFVGANQNQYTSEQSRGNLAIRSPAKTGHKMPMKPPSGRKNPYIHSR